MPTAALFDLDGTILRLPSAEATFFGWLRRERGMGMDAVRGSIEILARRLLRDPSAATMGNRGYLRGLPVEEIEALAEKCVEGALSERFYTEALDLIGRHREKGHRLILVSGSAQFLVDPISYRLGFDYAVGSRIETDEGRFTGFLENCYPYGRGKLSAVGEARREAGFTPSRSFAYANRFADRHFLSTVGHPVAVNPTPRLRMYAAFRGWDTLRFK